MEETLYEAAVSGDVKILEKLLQEDPHILDKSVLKCSENSYKTPLHIAAMFGHVNFAKKISEVCFDMCFARDRDGRNPLHISAIKGNGEVLEVLLIEAGVSMAVRERTDGGGTILHLCVKYNQLEMLKIVLRFVQDSEFLNAKNDEGLTVLHLAVLDQQIETIRCLAETNIDVNTKNGNDKTALDIAKNLNLQEMANILQHFGALANSEITVKGGEWLDKLRDTIMIVATLIATFAFQAGLNPPGGVWQEDSDPPPWSPSPAPAGGKRVYKAGEAILGYNHPEYYKNFVRVNTVAFVSSLSTILFLISGLPFKNKFIMWVLLVIMWLTVTSVALTYGIAIFSISARKDYKVIAIAVAAWCVVMSLLLIGNTIRLIRKWRKGVVVKKLRSSIRIPVVVKGPTPVSVRIRN